MNKLGKYGLWLSMIVLSACSLNQRNTGALQTQVIYEQSNHWKAGLNESYQSLAKDLEIVQIQSKRVNDLLKMEATIENKKAFTQAIQYQVRWYDRSGQQLAESTGGRSGWVPESVDGRQQVRVSQLAPNIYAVGFDLSVRQVK